MPHLDTFIVAHHEATLIGTIGLEVLPRGLGLLRSLAVAPPWRGRGLGQSLCLAMIAEAQKRRVGELWLLTTSAERYSARLGFAFVPRTECPPELRNTAEFATLCPATAISRTRPARRLREDRSMVSVLARSGRGKE